MQQNSWPPKKHQISKLKQGHCKDAPPPGLQNSGWETAQTPHSKHRCLCAHTDAGGELTLCLSPLGQESLTRGSLGTPQCWAYGVRVNTWIFHTRAGMQTHSFMLAQKPSYELSSSLALPPSCSKMCFTLITFQMIIIWGYMSFKIEYKS